MRIWTLLVLSIFLAMGSAAENGAMLSLVDELFKQSGVEEEKRKAILAAFKTAEEEGDTLPLRPYLADSNEAVALMAGATLGFLEPNRTGRRARRLLDRGKGNTKSLLAVQSLIPGAQTMDDLLTRWESGKYAEHEKTIQLALRATTGESREDLTAWKTWWAENRETHEFEEIETLDDAYQRMQFAVNAGLHDSLNRITNAFSKKGQAADKVGEIFGKMANLNELGMEPESEFAEAGDKHFAGGELEEAAKSYAEAIAKFPDDVKSAFLLACLEFERGELEAAQKRFQEIAENDESAHAASVLSRITTRRLEAPEEDFMETLIQIAAGESWEELATMILDDPVMSRIIGQQSVGRGIFRLSVEELILYSEKHPDDPEIQFGVTYLMNPVRNESQLKLLAARFPHSALIQSQYVLAATSTTISESDRPDVEVATLRWEKTDPGNLTPVFIREVLPYAEDRSGIDLPDEVWERLLRLPEKGMVAKQWNVEANQAVRRVQMAFEHPFPLYSQFPHFQTHLVIPFTRNLHVRLMEERPGEMDRVKALLQALLPEPNSAIGIMLRESTLLTLPSIQRERLSRTANEEEADELNRQIGRQARQLSTQALDSEILSSLCVLPIPSIRAEYEKRLRADETGFKEWMYRRLTELRAKLPAPERG